MNKTPEQQYFFQRMQEGGEAAVGPSRVIEELPTNAIARAMYDHFGSEEAVRRELDAAAAREKLLEEQQNKTAADVMSAVANSGVDMNNPRARDIMNNMEQSGENPENLRTMNPFTQAAEARIDLGDGRIVRRGTPVGLGTPPARTFAENEIANNDAILNRMAQKNYTENERDFGFNVGALVDKQMVNSDQTTLQALLSLLESGQISEDQAEQAFNRIKQKEREAEQAASVQAMNAFNQAAEARRGLSLSREGLSIPKRGN